MRTEVLRLNEPSAYGSALQRAADALRRGALVIFPTETVYGVAANAADAGAITRLRSVKGRPSDKPFTVHLGRRGDARSYVPTPSPLARRLARKAWPGPLTLVCEAPSPEQTPIAQSCPESQLKEIFFEGTVGLRCPDHPAATELLSQADVPVVASSANRAGNAAPFELEAALADLDGQVEIALDGGRTRLNSSSTIVEVRGHAWSVQRTGVLDERTIRRMAVSEVVFVCTGNSCRSPLAEYMFRHKLAERMGVPVAKLAELGIVVSSAGSFAGGGSPISGGSLDELSRRGIDASGHRSQPLTPELIQRSERIFVMSPEHREAVLDMAPGLGARVEMLDPSGPVQDPVGGTADDYRRSAQQIEACVARRVEEYLNEDRDW